MSDNDAAIQVAEPDWDYWLDVPSVELWQAVALACGIEPSSLSAFGGFDPQRLINNGANVAHKEILIRRISLAISNANVLGVYPTINDQYKPTYQLKVNLSRFVEWALMSLNRPWSDMPKELAALAQINNLPRQATISDEAATQTFTGSNTNKLATKREHALRSLIDMAKKNAINPSSTNDVFSELVKLADSKLGCLLEFVDDDGVKYQSDQGVKFYTKRMLREQLRRDRQ